MRYLKVTGLILLVFMIISPNVYAIPVQWSSSVGGNDHYYEYIYSPDISWTAAMAAAEGMTHLGQSGYLVTITSLAENNFVANLYSGDFRAWIGLTDSAVEGTWEWVTGEAFSFSYWSGGEPSGDGDYVEMFASNDRWNDRPDWSNTYNPWTYFVEYDAPAPVPEPATMLLLGSGLIGLAGFSRKKFKK